MCPAPRFTTRANHPGGGLVVRITQADVGTLPQPTWHWEHVRGSQLCVGVGVYGLGVLCHERAEILGALAHSGTEQSQLRIVLRHRAPFPVTTQRTQPCQRLPKRSPLTWLSLCIIEEEWRARICCVSCAPMFLWALHTGLLSLCYVILMPMFNVHPYFSLKNLGKKVHYTQQNTGTFEGFRAIYSIY